MHHWSSSLVLCVILVPKLQNAAKGLTVQWQRPLVGVLPLRVQTLGAAPN